MPILGPSPDAKRKLNVWCWNLKVGACAAGVLSGALAWSGPVLGGEWSRLPVYETAAAVPAVDHVIGSVRVRECRADATPARSAALDRLRSKASALGATGLLAVEVAVGESTIPYLKNGVPNPCRFETVARGDAAVLRARPAASQMTAAQK
jgi:uncharacterized protein YbjQ (UPF0145 family)